jgi:hypothetical protein
MKRFKLSESGQRGWFIGDFPEAILRTKDFEVSWQTCPAGPAIKHVHKIITEIMLITRGKISINGEIFSEGDIVMIEPNDINDSEYLEDTDTVTIKFPSIPDDKYLL